MERVITDKAGRSISLRRVGVVETLRLYKVLGANLSLNPAYMGMAEVAASIEALDGIPIPFPDGEAAVEHILRRLGDDATDLVSAAIMPKDSAAVVAEAGN
jgi:hypothetical protein